MIGYSIFVACNAAGIKCVLFINIKRIAQLLYNGRFSQKHIEVVVQIYVNKKITTRIDDYQERIKWICIFCPNRYSSTSAVYVFFNFVVFLGMLSCEINSLVDV